MNSKIASELIRQLGRKNEERPSITVKLSGDIAGILERYRSATMTEKGNPGKLESYSEVAGKLIKAADEFIGELALKKDVKDTGQ